MQRWLSNPKQCVSTSGKHTQSFKYVCMVFSTAVMALASSICKGYNSSLSVCLLNQVLYTALAKPAPFSKTKSSLAAT
eukprot:120827-Pelagomonas_calceolata.AAC.1